MLFRVRHIKYHQEDKIPPFSKVLGELRQKMHDLKGTFCEILVGKGAKTWVGK